MEKIINSILNNNSYFTVKWRLTDWCNYRCSYCLRKSEEQNNKTDFGLILLNAKFVNNLFNQINKPIKLNLIGGEVTWFDLKLLISKLTSQNLKKINITTNMSNSIDYYIDFFEYLKSREIDLSLRCSIHEEFVDIEKFIVKASIIKAKIKNLNLEYVITEKNYGKIELIQKLCNKYEMNIIFELDKNIINNEFRNTYKNISNPYINRYSIIYEDGSINNIITRNELIRTNSEQFENNFMKTNGFYCTKGLSCLYIKYDKIVENSSCCKHKYVPIKDFNLRTLDNMKLCNHNKCSLTGDFSISKDKNVLLDFFKK